MTLVKDSIRLGPEAVEIDLEAQPQRGGDPALRAKAHAVEPAGLQIDDHRPADACTVGNILLTPAPSLPYRANQPANLNVMHRPNHGGPRLSPTHRSQFGPKLVQMSLAGTVSNLTAETARV